MANTKSFCQCRTVYNVCITLTHRQIRARVHTAASSMHGRIAIHTHQSKQLLAVTPYSILTGQVHAAAR
jgi:hypothetical protein